MKTRVYAAPAVKGLIDQLKTVKNLTLKTLSTTLVIILFYYRNQVWIL